MHRPTELDRLMSNRNESSRTKKTVAARNGAVEQEAPSRILIVDDDPDILESLKDLIELSGGGYDIDTALDADSALQAARAAPPSVAIIDVKLGASNGIDLIPRLQRVDQDTICIIMTAYRDPSYAARALESGANEFLYKPLDPEQMSNLLTRLARRDPSEDDH